MRSSPDPITAQGAGGFSQLPCGCQPVGWRMGADAEKQVGSGEAQLFQQARQDWKKRPWWEGDVCTLKDVWMPLHCRAGPTTSLTSLQPALSLSS